MLKLADLFFTCFHSIIIVFNLFGWVFRATRKWNLIILLLTGASWVGLGLFYGPGYCPLTDWHFRILQKMGQEGLPASYISYLLQRIFGWHARDSVVDSFTLAFYLAALALSLYLNVRDFIFKRSGRSTKDQS